MSTLPTISVYYFLVAMHRSDLCRQCRELEESLATKVLLSSSVATEKLYSINYYLSEMNICWYRIYLKLSILYILNISPYSVRMRENVDQNNSEYGHFLRSQQCIYFFACVELVDLMLWEFHINYKLR